MSKNVKWRQKTCQCKKVSKTDNMENNCCYHVISNVEDEILLLVVSKGKMWMW